MADQNRSTENPESSSQNKGQSCLDEVIQREVRPVEKRDRRLARLFVLVVCLVLILLVGGVLFEKLLSPQPVRQPSPQELFHSGKFPVPQRLPHAVVEPQQLTAPAASDNEQSAVIVSTPATTQVAGTENTSIAPVPNSESNPVKTPYDMIIGPFITKSRLHEAEEFLKEKGLLFVSEAATGPVNMMRLREGVYAPEIARKRLKEMIKAGFGDSFVLPAGANLAVYAGSFIDQQRADMLSKDLAQKNIRVVQINVELNKQGQVLKLKELSEAICTVLEQEFEAKGIHTHKEAVR